MDFKVYTGSVSDQVVETGSNLFFKKPEPGSTSFKKSETDPTVTSGSGWIRNPFQN